MTRRPDLAGPGAGLRIPGPAPDQRREILKELRALRERVDRAREEAAGGRSQAARRGQAQWGMTPEQAREFNRIAIKAEALQDNFADQGFKGLKISGMMDPTYIYTTDARRQLRLPERLRGNGGDLSYPTTLRLRQLATSAQAVLDFQKETEAGTRWRLTLAPQRTPSSGFNGGSIVHEATVSLPLTDNQTRLVGRPDPRLVGLRVHAAATEQPLITHNLLFDFTMPSFYTGAALDVTRGKWWYAACSSAT